MNTKYTPTITITNKEVSSEGISEKILIFSLSDYLVPFTQSTAHCRVVFPALADISVQCNVLYRKYLEQFQVIRLYIK